MHETAFSSYDTKMSIASSDLAPQDQASLNCSPALKKLDMNPLNSCQIHANLPRQNRSPLPLCHHKGHHLLLSCRPIWHLNNQMTPHPQETLHPLEAYNPSPSKLLFALSQMSQEYMEPGPVQTIYQIKTT